MQHKFKYLFFFEKKKGKTYECFTMTVWMNKMFTKYQQIQQDETQDEQENDTNIEGGRRGET